MIDGAAIEISMESGVLPEFYQSPRRLQLLILMVSPCRLPYVDVGRDAYENPARQGSIVPLSHSLPTEFQGRRLEQPIGSGITANYYLEVFVSLN